MEIEYKENRITADDYIRIESEMGDPVTTKEQAERSLQHQLFSLAAMGIKSSVLRVYSATMRFFGTSMMCGCCRRIRGKASVKTWWSGSFSM